MAMNDFSESKVTVKRMELLAKIKANREGHRTEFLEAQKGYREQAISELDRMLADARDGKRILRELVLIEPQDHTKDYDRVIAMLEMSVDETISVSSGQFAQYVMDEWGWMEGFKNSTSNYTRR